jgi:hypothetical protein
MSTWKLSRTAATRRPACADQSANRPADRGDMLGPAVGTAATKSVGKLAALAAAPLLVFVMSGAATLGVAVVEDTAPAAARARTLQVPHRQPERDSEVGGLAASAVPGATGVGSLYGDPIGAARYWHDQSYYDDCAEMAVADVVGLLTGHEPTEQQIVTLAENMPSTAHPGPIYDPRLRAGTNNLDVGVLLTRYGVHSITSADEAPASGVSTDVDSLEESLAHGQKAIVGINAYVLWNRPTGDHTRQNHFVVVTGIDAKSDVVHLNDSGITNGQDEQIPIAVFTAAWATSYDERTITDPVTTYW